MKATGTFLLFALFCFSGLRAESICKRLSVFFETDEYELSEVAMHRLDSLVTLAGQNQFLLELYGHTDTVGNTDHNWQLSVERMHAIEGYLDSKTKNVFTYRENEMPETNSKVSGSTEKNLAYNRRVDVFLIPTNGNNVVVAGKPNESVEIPLDYFGNCGICGSKPEVKSFYSADDLQGTNIKLETNDSFKLETAGTMLLDYKPCSNGAGYGQSSATVVFKVCGQKPDARISLWVADTMNGKIYWKPSNAPFTYNPATGCYEFSAPAGQLYNLDKVLFDTTFRVELPDAFVYNHAVMTRPKGVRANTWQDKYPINAGDTVCMLHAFAQDSEQVYLLAAPVSELPDTLFRNGRVYTTAFTASTTMYKPLTYSDSLVQIRPGKFARKAQFGFYLPEYNEFIPMDSAQGKYVFGKKPNVKYQYGYLIGKKLYVIPMKKVKAKSAGEATLIKFGRKSRKSFRRVTDYKPH